MQMPKNQVDNGTQQKSEEQILDFIVDFEILELAMAGSR